MIELPKAAGLREFDEHDINSVDFQPFLIIIFVFGGINASFAFADASLGHSLFHQDSASTLPGLIIPSKSDINPSFSRIRVQPDERIGVEQTRCKIVLPCLLLYPLTVSAPERPKIHLYLDIPYQSELCQKPN